MSTRAPLHWQTALLYLECDVWDSSVQPVQQLSSPVLSSQCNKDKVPGATAHAKHVPTLAVVASVDVLDYGIIILLLRLPQPQYGRNTEPIDLLKL